MNFFLRVAAFIFHPLFIPFFGAVIYYRVSPRFLELDLAKVKIAAIVIITILIPMVTFFLLKNLKLVKSIHLKDVKERKYPLMVQCLLLLLIIKMVYTPYDSTEMYYFFIALLFSGLTALLLVIFGFKVSLHQIGISNLTMFIIVLSIHFQINLLVGIGFLLFTNGWVATSRLHTKSHSVLEIIIGFFVGFIPQFILSNYWL